MAPSLRLSDGPLQFSQPSPSPILCNFSFCSYPASLNPKLQGCMNKNWRYLVLLQKGLQRSLQTPPRTFS